LLCRRVAEQLGSKDVDRETDLPAASVAQHGDDPEIAAILQEVCALTGMGFAAVARVTDTRWIACQVLDQIEFGLTAGGELDVATTICDEIRASGKYIVIDHVALDQDWRTHPTPILYGFQSYASFPLWLSDRSFYGTLCAIDPMPRRLQDESMIERLDVLARRVETVLSARVALA
jgi:GAF domain-containing protein